MQDDPAYKGSGSVGPVVFTVATWQDQTLGQKAGLFDDGRGLGVELGKRVVAGPKGVRHVRDAEGVENIDLLTHALAPFIAEPGTLCREACVLALGVETESLQKTEKIVR